MHLKKFNSLVLLCTFFILISFSGCVKDNVSLEQKTAQPAELRILTCGSSNKEASKRISKALSQITLKQYGFSVKLEQASLSEYRAIINRERMLGTTPDLFVYCEQNDLVGYVGKDAVLSLNSLLEGEGSNLYQQINKNVWNTVTLFNKIYAVPAVTGASYSLGFVAQKDIVDKLGVNPSDIKDWESLHSLLSLVKKTYPDMIPVVSHFGQVVPTLGEDPLGNGLGVLLDGNKSTVENLYSSNTYYTVAKRMNKWYNEGLILENAYSYAESYSTLFDAFNGFGVFVRLNEYSVTSAMKATGKEMIAFNISAPILNTSNYSLGWCISSATPYKVEAMQMLNLLYNDREVADLCIYGQENLDYTRLDENTVTNTDKKLTHEWITIPWAWPNRSVASSWAGGNSDRKPDKVPNNIIVSKAMGFVFEPSSVQNSVDQCKSVVDKYNGPLLCGYLNPDEAIPHFLEELKEAGIDSVIANKKYQLNVWLRNKGS